MFSYTGAVMTLPTGVQAIGENNYGNPDAALEVHPFGITVAALGLLVQDNPVSQNLFSVSNGNVTIVGDSTSSASSTLQVDS